MPGWTLHNNWAVKMGIPRNIAAWVNVREDVPKFPPEEQKSKFPQVSTMPVTFDDWESLEHKKAWLLHLLIDEVEDTAEKIIEEAWVNDIELIDIAAIELVKINVTLSPLVRMMSGKNGLGEVKVFFLENLQAITEEVWAVVPKV